MIGQHMTKQTHVEQRAEVHIFAGSDTAHTAQGVNGIATATPELTPLMLDDATGKLVVWDGQKAGTAVGILALALTGNEAHLTYYKSGTFATGALHWPDSVDAVKKANAFIGCAISHR
ncbi:bacteriophage lambda head decoration protein D [Providencia alcalifaciens DSM 30120]|uniref:Bacteriophage lambda head decoration protein D n=2 Tax=Providencia alcalifaciens TaxID=126385 RepID=B6XE20_9GAMM|nr:bacteriophage lambda head decoration protein D [Providencia alcalifaciens DSM 30120]